MSAKVIHMSGRGGVPMNAGDATPGLEGIRALGHDRAVFYFLSPLSQQIEAFSAGELNSPAHLCRLRPLDWWKEEYPPLNSRQPEFNVPRARQDLMDAAYAVGIWDPELVRGRGVWLSRGGQVVVHAGDWISSARMGWTPSEAPGPEIYEASQAWRDLLGDPLEEDEGRRLLDVCEALNFVHPSHGKLLAGWLTVAPVCGCLRWRPHIALTGPRESGKSFVLDEVVKAVLGPIALHALGETTAAGIRQTLGRDARPVIWDEAEPQGRRGAARVEEAIAFARHLSTSGGGAVLKGSASHKAQAFGGVAVLCLVSIFVQLLRDADVSRFTVLELRSRAGTEADEEAIARQRQVDRETRLLVEGLTPEFARDLLATTVANMETLRRNHDTFAGAVQRRFGSQRLGDQLGALLAGAWLLHSHELVGEADALAEASALPDEFSDGISLQSDEERCLARISSHWARVDTASGRRQVTRSLGELLVLAINRRGDDEISSEQASNVLRRHGLRVQDRRVLVATRHDRLAELMDGTDFGGDWGRLLERLPGAEKHPTAVRFGPGVQARSISLPAELFLQPGADGQAASPGTGTENGTGVPPDVPP